MGVIKQFAISSIVLGTLALAGGASAIAFEGGSEESPAVQPVDQPAQPSDVQSDVPADEPAGELPETGGPAAILDWFAPQGR